MEGIELFISRVVSLLLCAYLHLYPIITFFSYNDDMYDGTICEMSVVALLFTLIFGSIFVDKTDDDDAFFVLALR